MKPQKTFWVMSGALCLSIFGAMWTRADIYFRLAYLLIIVIILSWVWAVFSVRGIEVTRSTRGLRQQLGQVVEEQFEIRNRMVFPRPWVEVQDRSGLPGAGGGRILSWIKPNASRNYSGYTLLTNRGVYRLSPTQLVSGDIFGLFINQRLVENHQSLLVLPYIVDLQSFPFPSGLLPGGVAAKRRIHELTPPNVSGVHEYSPGEGFNRIHWPSSAKRDRLMVKEFEEDPQADIWIFLNAGGSSHFEASDQNNVPKLYQIPVWWLQKVVYTLPASTYEYAVSIAASVSKYFARADQVVGFASAGQKTVVLPAERGERQLTKILETLSFLNCHGKLPLAGLIEVQLGHIPRGSTVVVVTTSLDTSITQAINDLIRRDMRPVVVLIDVVSFGGSGQIDNIYSICVHWKIPVCVIKYGDDLREKLEKSFTTF